MTKFNVLAKVKVPITIVHSIQSAQPVPRPLVVITPIDDVNDGNQADTEESNESSDG